jgi:DNA mismatch endonuclease (patch repair protein)
MIMSHIKSKDTKPELLLRRALWRKGFRYRIHRRDIGNADIVFIKEKIAVFVDGEFWHGRCWKEQGKIPPKGYWQNKIMRNMERDNKTNDTLISEGWYIFRFWDSEVINSLDKCVAKILKKIGGLNLC